MKDFKNLPRLVGGIDKKSQELISTIYSHVYEYDVDAWFLPIIKFDCVPILGSEYYCNYMFHVKLDEKELFSADPVEMIEANEDLTDNSDIRDFLIQGMYMYICKLLKENNTIKDPEL